MKVRHIPEGVSSIWVPDVQELPVPANTVRTYNSTLIILIFFKIILRSKVFVKKKKQV